MTNANEFDSISAALSLRGYRNTICKRRHFLYDTLSQKGTIELPDGTTWFVPRGLFGCLRKPDVFLDQPNNQVFIAPTPTVISPDIGFLSYDFTWEKLPANKFMQDIDSICGAVGTPSSSVRRLLKYLHL